VPSTVIAKSQRPAPKPNKPDPRVEGTKFPLTLETLFTNEAFWGVTKATPVQRAKCRILEGRPVGDLKNHPDVVKMCGGIPAPDLTSPPRELLDVSATRIGKSLWGACSLFFMSQTADISHTRDSDIVNIFIVALKMEGCKAVLKHLVTPLTTKPLLRPFLVDPPEDITVDTAFSRGLKIRRPHDGRIIEVKCIPLDKGGGSAISVYCAGFVVDEYPRMASGEGGAVKNVEHFRDAVVARVVPKAVGIYTGSPWQPTGHAFDLVEKYFGKPSIEPESGSVDLLVLRTSAESFLDLPGIQWTSKLVEYTRRTAYRTYQTDYLAQFVDGAEVVFSPSDIDAAFARSGDFNDCVVGRPAIFADPSALRRDFWACMVGAWVIPSKVVHVEDLYETEAVGPDSSYKAGYIIPARNGGGWVRVLEDENGAPIPKKDKPPANKPYFKVFEIKSWSSKDGVRGLDLVRGVSALARRYQAEDFHWDGYEEFSLSTLLQEIGLRPIPHKWGGSAGSNSKTPSVDHLRTLFVEGRIELPAMPKNKDGSPNEAERLRTELLRFTSKLTPNGGITYQVAGGVGHGDHALALLIAMRADLGGYLDMSPTLTAAERVELHDNEHDNYYARAA
jgi:hypothetical protein